MSVVDYIHVTLSRYQRVSGLLKEKEEVNSKVLSLHAELNRCQARLIEIEDQLGHFSVDELVANARDQENRLALIRSQVHDIRTQVRANLVTLKMAEAEWSRFTSDFDFHL